MEAIATQLRARAAVAAGVAPDFDGLVREGEAALARCEPARAVELFEQAALQRHAAASEWGLVRAWMQQGRYSQAVAFAAHAAGVHQDLAAGAGLYAWLLHLGGQQAHAQRVLAQALEKHPGVEALQLTAQRLREPAVTIAPALLLGPTRQAPYEQDMSTQGEAVHGLAVRLDAQTVLLPASRTRARALNLVLPEGVRATLSLMPASPSGPVQTGALQQFGGANGKSRPFGHGGA